MNFPEIIGREDDADSDGTYCSDAEMAVMKPESSAGDVEMLALNNDESRTETKIVSISEESENDVIKPADIQDVNIQFQSCKLISKKSVTFRLQGRKNLGNPGLVKKSSRSIKKLQLLEQHRVKMKTHGETLTNRLYAIRKNVKIWIGGYGLQISKKHCITLYEEVKAIQNILTQLYQASRRLTNYIGGYLPFTYKRYSSANQICETLLIQLNPATYENSTHVSRTLKKDGFTSSNEDDTDSDHELSLNMRKKLPTCGNKCYALSERNRSNHLNQSKTSFTKPILNRQILEENVMKAMKTGQKSATEVKNQILTYSQEHGTCIVIVNNPSSADLNENLTLSQTNKYNGQEKIHTESLQHKHPETIQYLPEASNKMSIVDVEIIDLCEDDVSSSPELINMEVLKSYLNQDGDLPAAPKGCISREELVSHGMPLSDIINANESSEPKENGDQWASSQTQPSSCIQRYKMNKTNQLENIKSNMKKQTDKALESSYFDFDEFPEDNDAKAEPPGNINNLIDLNTVSIPCKESKCDETFQEETESSASQNNIPKMKGMRMDSMDNTQESNSNIDSISNYKLNVPSWCYIFEQHKIKNGLPTLIELMLAGMIHPGEKVLTIKDNDIKGSLLKNGKICTPEGATFQSPMAWCSAWSDGKSVSRNLSYQRVHYKGVPLTEVCQKAFEMALEELSAANLEKQSCDMTAEPELGCSVKELENDFADTAEELEEKELLEDPILAIEAVVLHSPEEFKVDEALESFFLAKGKFTADLDFIDEW